MEGLVQNIINNNLKTLRRCVEEMDTDIRPKFIFILLYQLVRDEVDPVGVYNILLLFSQHKMSFATVPKIASIIKILMSKANKLVGHYLITHIKHERRLKKMFGLLDQVRGAEPSFVVQKFHHIPKEKWDDLDTHRPLLLELDQLVKSFDDRRFIAFLRRPRLVKSVDSGQWHRLHTQELINRLQQMTDLFGVDLLQKMQIKTIQLPEFLEKSFSAQIDYFSHCCLHIRMMMNNLNNLLLKIGLLGMELEELQLQHALFSGEKNEDNQEVEEYDPGEYEYSDSDEEEVQSLPGNLESRNVEMVANDFKSDKNLQNMVSNFFATGESSKEKVES